MKSSNKKLILIPVLAALLALSACADPEGSGTQTVPTQADNAYAPGSEEDAQAAETAADADLPEEERTSFLSLYRTDSFEISLFAAHSLENGTDGFGFFIENISDAGGEFYCSDIILNGHMVIGGSVAMFVSEGETGFNVCDRIRDTLSLSGESLREISMDLSWQKGSCSVRLEIPEGFASGPVWLPFMGARAESQLLVENDVCRAELMACGALLDPVAFTELDLFGLLRVENLSDRVIPVKVCSILLNRISVPCYGGTQELAPGESAFLPFTVFKGEVESSGIRSVSSLSIQLLAGDDNATEKMGMVYGGLWYPVELAEAGEEEGSEQGELLYEDEELSVYFLGLDEWVTDPETNSSYTWRLRVDYSGNQDCELDLSEIRINGELRPELDQEYSCTFSSGHIGPGSSLVTELSFWGVVEERPEISGRLQIMSQGRTRLFRTTEVVEFPMEGPSGS